MAIQKYKPVYEEGNIKVQRAPFTQLCNKVLQTCSNLEAIAIWAYLQSQSDTWELSPSQLKKHFKIGKNKIYDILTYMIDTNLLVRNVHRSANGRKEKTSYTVLDGTKFLDISTSAQESVQISAPLPQNQEVDNQEVENGDTRKERCLKKKDKDINTNNISATDVAPEKSDKAFNEFWEWYPVKKNKVRAKKIWDRKKYTSILSLILTDVINRLKHDSQWQDKQYIPHPSTYLGNELWNDEITTHSSISSSSKNKSGDALSRVINKHLNRGNVYDHGTGNTIDPLR